MREILFKAKRIDNGEWVEGIPIKTHIGLFMCFDENPHYCHMYGYMEIDKIIKVDENTLCQYTGYEDDSGNKIFENDLIECKEFSNGHLIKHFFSQVEWDAVGTGFAFKDDKFGWAFMDSLTVYECEVIGNIFDNPELLKGSEEE